MEPTPGEPRERHTSPSGRSAAPGALAEYIYHLRNE